MAKLLRVVVVLTVLMAGTAVWLEYQLFRARMENKASVQTLEANVLQLAEQLAAAREPYIEAIDQKINRHSLMRSESMDRQLRVVEALMDNRYEQLFTSRDELKKTTDELNQTKDELAKTKRDLEAAKNEIAMLKERIVQKDAEIAKLNEQIARQEQRVAELKQTIEANKQRIAEIENKNADLKDEVLRLEVELARYLNDPNIVKQMPKGLAGRIVAVNDEWNFVVLDIGKREGLVKDAYMMVHRGDQFIGKVRITQTADHMAVADIERQWMVAPIQEGDRVLY